MKRKTKLEARNIKSARQRGVNSLTSKKGKKNEKQARYRRTGENQTAIKSESYRKRH